MQCKNTIYIYIYEYTVVTVYYNLHKIYEYLVGVCMCEMREREPMNLYLILSFLLVFVLLFQVSPYYFYLDSLKKFILTQAVYPNISLTHPKHVRYVSGAYQYPIPILD